MKSPLRYPGGKAKIAPLLQRIMEANDLHGASYVEPYAGGAGAGLKLLADEAVDRILLNDSDPFIAALWEMCIGKTNELVDKINSTPITIEEWEKQRSVYINPKKASMERRAFAALFLNRCNRSGIISGGPIGGRLQAGEWRLDVRFRKQTITERVRNIAEYGERISFIQEDALHLLRTIRAHTAQSDRIFVYLDPPYFEKASRLYLNHYIRRDHANLASFLKNDASFPWVLTYDDHPEIREYYMGNEIFQFQLNYSAHSKRKGTELLILSDKVKLPTEVVDKFGLIRQ